MRTARESIGRDATLESKVEGSGRKVARDMGQRGEDGRENFEDTLTDHA